MWKLLDKSLTRFERGEIFTALIQSLGLFRADWLVRPMGHWILPDEPAFRSIDDDATKHVIQYLANTPSLDGIALLGCAYKEAIDRLDLVEANSYLKGMRSLFVVIAKPFPANVKTWIGDLQAIVEKRVCRNDWTDLYASSARVKSRAKHGVAPESDARSKAIALLNGDALYRGTQYFAVAAPIVPINDRLHWFHANRHAISDGYEAAERPFLVDTLSVNATSVGRETTEDIADKLGLSIPPAK
ncbi:hypothetical protein [Rhodanobacter sp. MP7CTX1]|uniref:hypothetical protein n=1 Tax=Rhodanobacter sp. MP7CTX1 TaxID=2723084 RepID=UPI00161E11A7|nr:hypothetical protein [Rhodanobacter sp. MP7CTX1]MBB6188012.1 hypothetical protein [Rhodanobacter sp. MP7CTX1]